MAMPMETKCSEISTDYDCVDILFGSFSTEVLPDGHDEPDKQWISKLIQLIKQGESLSALNLFQGHGLPSKLSFDKGIPNIKKALFDQHGENADSEECQRYQHGENIDCNSKCSHWISQVTCLGVTCLRLFVQQNWTGPKLDTKQVDESLQFLFSKEFDDIAAKDLNLDGDVIHHMTQNAALFWIAHSILVENADTINHLQNYPVWKLRCLSVYQELLEERSSTLKAVFDEITEKFATSDALHNWPRNIKAEFFMECVHLYLQYYEYEHAKESLEAARSLIGIETSLKGALGKRTKFQENELPQMVLDVHLSRYGREQTSVKSKGESTQNLPVDVTLDNDTLLANVKFVDPKMAPELSGIEQTFIVASSLYFQRTSPRDKLLTEEILPYLECVLCDPQCWATQCQALYMRSCLESDKSRKVERSLMQLETLVESHRKESPKPHERIKYLHSVALPPHWTIERTLGRLHVRLGSTKSALETFLRLQSWEDAISCYQRLGRHEKAENLIREQLKEKETAKLWCILGDVTNDSNYYEKAWEFSGHRSARAQRSLGFFHLRAGRLNKCIPCFQESLKISSLQPSVWFSLGCASMATAKFDVAVKAFQRCVSLDPENHEAWNNLANVYIKIGQKAKAFRALQESLRSSFDNWQIWENFLLVSTDLGEFEEVIHACHRLLEIKKRHIDVEVLGILVKAVKNGTLDAREQPASRLKSKVQQLFGRITSQVTNNADVWSLYGDLFIPSQNKEDKEKALQFFIKAQRYCIQNNGWENDIKKVPEAINVSKKLIHATNEVISTDQTVSRVIQLASSTKMSISNFIKKLKELYVNSSTGELHEDIQESVADIENDINLLTKHLET